MLAGIESTQVGDPLAHGQEPFLDCISPDRVIGLSVASVAEGEDEEVSNLASWLGTSPREGWRPSLLQKRAQWSKMESLARRVLVVVAVEACCSAVPRSAAKRRLWVAAAASRVETADSAVRSGQEGQCQTGAEGAKHHQPSRCPVLGGRSPHGNSGGDVGGRWRSGTGRRQVQHC